MGCASSKKMRCQNCKNNISRTYSEPIHHRANRKGDSYHVVALTSSTLGSLKLDSIDETHLNGISMNGSYIDCKSNNNESRIKEFEMGVNQAKTWSDMINEKIPKVMPRTPIRTPPGEPETINSWELMAGLEDDSPLRVADHLNRCFSYHGVPNSTTQDHQPTQRLQENDQLVSNLEDNNESPKLNLQENGSDSLKPMWVQVVEDETISSLNAGVNDFDQENIFTLRKPTEELSPTSPINLESPKYEKLGDACLFLKKGTPKTCPPNGENNVVIYFTSLRGVRKTYEDCCQVRVILKGFGVKIDERDVSMHSGFREELKELLGGEYRGGLPRVFVKGDYIGGAEEVKQLHEDGELEKLLKGCDFDDGVCEACGDVRFVPCETCSGSCKIYYEEEEEDDDEEEDSDEKEEEEGEENGGGFHRCPDCNENGITRCPVCCY